MKKKKRCIIPAARRKEIAERIRYLEFRWSTSRGYATYGYTLCSIWVNGTEKIAATCGVGYDLAGVVLGGFIKEYFEEYLKKLDPGVYYGLSFYDAKKKKHRKHYNPGNTVYLDGACGFRSMQAILHALGFTIEQTINKANVSIYQFNSR
jgi:hypothetical protein